MGCGCGGKKRVQAMQMQLSGEMVEATIGPGVVNRMVFKTSLKQRLMLDPAIPGATFCIPAEDAAANPTIFVAGGPCP